MDEIEERLVQAAQVAGAAAHRPPFEQIARRARHRRRTRALGGLGLSAAAAVTVVALVAQGGGTQAVPPADPVPTAVPTAAPTAGPSPTASDRFPLITAPRGVVGRVELLPGGGVVAVYDRCERFVGICVPRVWSRSAGGEWVRVPLPEDGPEGDGLHLQVTTAGDPVIELDGQIIYSPDEGASWRSPRTRATPALTIVDPTRAAWVNAGLAVTTAASFNQGVNGLLDVATGEVHPASLPDEGFEAGAAPVDPGPGLLTNSEMKDQRGYLSFDLGSTWTPLPGELPGLAFGLGPSWQGSDQLVSLGAGEHGTGQEFVYSLRTISTSTDLGRTWTDTTLPPEPVVKAWSVSPLPDGGFLGADLENRLVEAGPDGVFRRVRGAPWGRVSATGASSAGHWVVMDQSQVYQRSGAGGEWRRVPLPED